MAIPDPNMATVEEVMAIISDSDLITRRAILQRIVSEFPLFFSKYETPLNKDDTPIAFSKYQVMGT